MSVKKPPPLFVRSATVAIASWPSNPDVSSGVSAKIEWRAASSSWVNVIVILPSITGQLFLP